MAIAETFKSQPSKTLSPSIPKLRDGERLSRDEFERRYAGMPDVKAELLDGVVYIMSSPVSFSGHASPDQDLNGWLYNYKIFTPGVDGGANATTRLSEKDEPQPDAVLFVLESHGGSSRVDDDDYLAGSPELLGEVSKSSATYDLKIKLPIYQRNGIQEVILWRIKENTIDWYILRNGEYEPLKPDANGIIRSETFPGLWLDVNAMLRRDGQQVLKALQQGIASPEHAEFVERLRLKAEKKG